MTHLLSKIFLPITSNIVKCNHNILRLSSSKPKYTLTLDSEVDNQYESEGLMYRKHCGRRNVGCVTLPPRLEIAAHKLINKYNNGPKFKDDAENMMYQFHVNQMPVEDEQLRERAQEIAYMYAMRENIDFDSLDDDEKDLLLERIKKKTMDRLRYVTFHWKEVVYDDYMSAVYAATRLAPNYAALFAVFKEIQTTDPNFRPETLFDFGSGIGTTTWAANEVWQKSLTEYFCVDISADVNEFSRLLLQGGEENKKMAIENVFYRQYLPASHNIKYDIVVSAFSLLELPDAKNRIHVIENLWHKTQDLLVIIEHGTRPGFAAVLEARNLILEKTGHKLTERFAETNVSPILDTDVVVEQNFADSHIIAPCPHEFACPRQSVTKKHMCRFGATHIPLDYGQPNVIPRKEPYSYVVLRKGARKHHSKIDTWPRIVQPVLRKHHHAICRLCCSDGNLHEIIVIKDKIKKDSTSKHLYICAKTSKWGDKFPGNIKLKEENNNTDENIDENIDSNIDSNIDENIDRNIGSTKEYT